MPYMECLGHIINTIPDATHGTGIYAHQLGWCQGRQLIGMAYMEGLGIYSIKTESKHHSMRFSGPGCTGSHWTCRDICRELGRMEPF